MNIWQRPLLLKERSEESVIEFRVLYLKVRHPAKPLSKNQIQFLCPDSLLFSFTSLATSKDRENAVSRNANRRHLPEFDRCLAFSTLLFQAALLLPQCWDAEVVRPVHHADTQPWQGPGEEQGCALFTPSSFTEAGALLSSISSRLFG